MGSIRAGDIRQFTYFGKELDIKGEDANVGLDLGGYQGETGINGNGTLHGTRRRKKASLSDVPVSIDDDRKDLEFLQEKADANEPGPLTIGLASGVTYRGSMVLVGEVKKSTGDGIASLTFEGSKLEQI
jgi:hypothetical protein